jgi:hypothetical protein
MFCIHRAIHELSTNPLSLETSPTMTYGHRQTCIGSSALQIVRPATTMGMLRALPFFLSFAFFFLVPLSFSIYCVSPAWNRVWKVDITAGKRPVSVSFAAFIDSCQLTETRRPGHTYGTIRGKTTYKKLSNITPPLRPAASTRAFARLLNTPHLPNELSVQILRYCASGTSLSGILQLRG